MFHLSRRGPCQRHRESIAQSDDQYLRDLPRCKGLLLVLAAHDGRHGAKGQSISPTFPNLAAQLAPYIETQLKAFKDQSRADPDAQAFMWGMASQLSDDKISALAAYFAAQPAATGRSGTPQLIAQGKTLFEQGVPARGIPPCASCHGAHAEGQAVFPRLAGQHAPYLLKQLLVIQSVLRTAPVMHGVIKDLTKDQMQAVVAYLESI